MSSGQLWGLVLKTVALSVMVVVSCGDYFLRLWRSRTFSDGCGQLWGLVLKSAALKDFQ